MKQTIEIEVPEGKKAVWKDGKVIFEDIAPKLSETWEEFCNSHFITKEWLIGGNSHIVPTKLRNRHPEIDRNVLPSQEAAEAHLALMQLHQLRDCYRQGWTPDWDDQESIKYCIDHEIKNYIIREYGKTPHFLSFQSQELAEKFLKNFKDLIDQAGDLI